MYDAGDRICLPGTRAMHLTVVSYLYAGDRIFLQAHVLYISLSSGALIQATEFV
jgi:hypothetical protein